MLRVAVARVVEGTPALPGWMADAERRRWTDLAPPARRAFTASRGLLRELLFAATGIPAHAWDVSARAGIAPVARAPRAVCAGAAPHVSLSHRLDWVAAAVSDTPVGVDIECERPPRSPAADRAALMLSPAELDAWRALALPLRDDQLLVRWTAKEAWFKASPSDAAPWDFRRIAARACRAGDRDANVRTWTAPPVRLALCCADARALAAVECDGLVAAGTSCWHVHRVASAA